MKKIVSILLVVMIFAIVHEGTHALTAALAGEYQAFHVRPFGLEVTYITPVRERHGIQWALIAGSPRVITVLIGYALFAVRPRIASTGPRSLRGLG